MGSEGKRQRILSSPAGSSSPSPSPPLSLAVDDGSQSSSSPRVSPSSIRRQSTSHTLLLGGYHYQLDEDDTRDLLPPGVFVLDLAHVPSSCSSPSSEDPQTSSSFLLSSSLLMECVPMNSGEYYPVIFVTPASTMLCSSVLDTGVSDSLMSKITE
ncbi:hypothetical protein Dimus_012599 [Dionaea muscipula]